MDKSAPNYGKYTYSELLDVRARINREKFPQRLKIVEELISKKENNNDVPSGERKTSNDRFVFGASIGEAVVWFIVLIFTVFK